MLNYSCYGLVQSSVGVAKMHLACHGFLGDDFSHEAPQPLSLAQLSSFAKGWDERRFTGETSDFDVRLPLLFRQNKRFV